MNTREGLSAHAIQEWLIEKVAEEMRIDPNTIDPRESFSYYGLDSVAGVTLATDLEAHLGFEIEATLIWDYPSIDALAEHLAELARQRVTP